MTATIVEDQDSEGMELRDDDSVAMQASKGGDMLIKSIVALSLLDLKLIRLTGTAKHKRVRDRTKKTPPWRGRG
jgi:hypothetical protein